MKFGFAVLVSVVVLVLLVLSASSSSYGSSSNFIHGVLPPPPPGSTQAYNVAAEPAIRSDHSGNFYISSENGVGAGTDAWKSSNGGTSYSSLAQPNGISSASASETTGFAPGGGDTDLATASALNSRTSNAQYNVYVSSLTVGSVTVSASQDGGLTWQSNVYSATVPGDDRDWIAAYGANVFYISYHNIPSGDEIIVNEGELVNGIPTSVGTYSAINPAQTDIYLGTYLDNELGNIAVDQNTGNVYQIFVGCPQGATQVVTCGNFPDVYIAVGTPTGVNAAGLPVLTFNDYIVYQDPNQASNLNNNFPNVVVDSAGNIYATWSDDQNVYVAYSTNHGQSWSSATKVNSGMANTAIYPWLAADGSGEVDLVYYGTPASANFQSCNSGTPSKYDCQNEPWYVFLAQNLDALKSSSKWSQQQVTNVVHYGGVCQGGISCTSTGNDNRDLYDDFGVAINPVTGFASIAYSDDQYSDNVGTANAGECSAAQTNSVSCDHTDYVTQIGGARALLFSPASLAIATLLAEVSSIMLVVAAGIFGNATMTVFSHYKNFFVQKLAFHSLG
jgi:hypothetical protein